MSRNSTTSCSINRREFIRQSAVAAATAGMIGAGHPAARAMENATPPSDRLAIGMIGTGGMGCYHLEWLAAQPELAVVALCDVDSGHLDRAQQLVETKSGRKGCRTFHDFRELVALADVDAVFVVTPDHWHAIPAIAALHAGKDVYCEKPLTHSIAEGRALCDAATTTGRVVQCGSHERSNPNVRRAAEIVQSGKLGEVKTVRIYMPCDEPHHQAARQQKLVLAAVPPELDYDFWLGPTEAVPYAEQRCHFGWRFNHRYGGGEMTDRGAHIIDLAQMILGLDATGPTEIVANGSQLTGGLYDVFLDFEFDNQYANGVRFVGEKTGPRGLRLEGSEGSLFVHVHGGKLEAEPASLLDGPPTEPIEACAFHRQNFFDALRSRGTTHAPPEAAHRTASICHLNNLSMQLGRPLKWDPVQEQIVGDNQANELLKPAMRAPWHI